MRVAHMVWLTTHKNSWSEISSDPSPRAGITYAYKDSIDAGWTTTGVRSVENAGKHVVSALRMLCWVLPDDVYQTPGEVDGTP